MIFHIAPRADWAAARAAGRYAAGSLASDGFIHCSNAEQVAMVADRFYADATDLVLLCIDPALVEADLVFDQTPDGSFPHIYGAIPISAVADAVEFGRRPNGFEFPWRAAALARYAPRSVAELGTHVRRLLEPFGGRWWIGGGWAIDLFLGEAMREHEDIDIVIAREDVPRFGHEMQGWDLRIPLGEHVPLPRWRGGELYPDEAHQLWSRREVQLLYKAKAHPHRPRTNDEDLQRALPSLDDEARAWLRDALHVTYPSHPWLAILP